MCDGRCSDVLLILMVKNTTGTRLMSTAVEAPTVAPGSDLSLRICCGAGVHHAQRVRPHRHGHERHHQSYGIDFWKDSAEVPPKRACGPADYIRFWNV